MSSDPRSLIADVLTSVDTGRERIPALLGLLDVGDRQVRLGAALTLCVVASDHSDVVPSLVRRLLDRETLEAELAVAYLAVRHADAVEAELDAAEADDDRLLLGDPTGDRSALTDRDVGRTRLGGGDTDSDPRQVYSRDDDEDDQDGGTGGTMGDPEDGDASTGNPDWLSVVEYESPFDSLSLLAPRDRRRYGDTYRTLGVADETEYAVAVTLLYGPATATERNDVGTAFASAVGERLSDWDAVSGTDNVVTVHGWGTEPRLWTATEYTDETLADRGRLGLAEAAWHAEQLAEAVSALHERGVVHAGIGPQSVAYYGNVLTEGDRQPPLLDNVGLLHAYRRQFEPSTYLDPRYAAPEYYERRFGRVDHATDIYQLGAVCYRLFTGRPPYAGEFDTVRERVVEDTTPTPSDVASVPTAVDAVVGKAMATQKLRRYETAAHLAQELRALREPRRDNGG